MKSLAVGTAETVAKPAATEASVVLRSKKTAGGKSAYSDFLGKLANTGISSAVEDEVDEDDEDHTVLAARIEGQREATRQQALAVRRGWLERMEASIESDGFARDVPTRAAASVSRARVAKSRRNGTELDKFEAAGAFDGPRPGFVFKAGPHGTGYYADASKGTVQLTDAGASLLASAPSPPKPTTAISAEEEEAAWAALDVSDPAPSAPAPRAAAPVPAPAPPPTPRTTPSRPSAAAAASSAAVHTPDAPKPPEPEIIAKAGQPSTGESSARAAQRAAELRAADEAKVEFGSMRVAQEDSSSSEEEEEPDDDEVYEPEEPVELPPVELPPGARRKQLMIERAGGGGDDSDGEIEYG